LKGEVSRHERTTPGTRLIKPGQYCPAHRIRAEIEFGLWRLLLVLLLIGGWPYLVSFYAERAGLTADQRSSLQAYRWRLALWLLALELIACQALLTHFAETVMALKAGFA
jgi:hypothetical protein